MADLKHIFDFIAPKKQIDRTGSFIPNDIGFGPNGLLYVCDSLNHRVQSFDFKGKLKFQYNIKHSNCIGNEKNQYLCFSPENLLYINNFDWYLNVTEVYDLYFKPKFEFENQKEDKKSEKFNKSERDYYYNWEKGKMCFGPNGLLYVCDQHNHCVQVFDKRGKFQFRFGKKGKEDGQFKKPKLICFGPNGLLYVGDDNYYIQVFDIDGNFQFKFNVDTDMDFFSTYGIDVSYYDDNKNAMCFGPNQLLYISYYNYARGIIVIYNQKGEFQYLINMKDHFDFISIQYGPKKLLYVGDKKGSIHVFQHTKDKTLYQIIAESLFKKEKENNKKRKFY